jgi:hypothetical protein
MRFAICNETFLEWPHDRAFAFARQCGYDDRQPSEKSLMPDDLPHQLTIQEFRDLLAFLTTTK